MIELNNLDGDYKYSSEIPNESEKNKLIIINDSDYKHNRKSKIDFSTSYLTFLEEIKLMTFQKILVYKQNLKVLSFILLSPLIFLLILHIFQKLSDKFSQSTITKDPEIIDIDNINLKCTENLLGKYDQDCISIGLAIIGRVTSEESNQINHLINSIANQTNLAIDRDIKLIASTDTIDLYTYFEENPNKVQYVISFCFSSFSFSNVTIPCRREYIYNPKYNTHLLDFNFYTIIYNITNVPNGFLNSFNDPWPVDNRLLRLKMVIDNAYMDYYAGVKGLKIAPRLENIKTQAFPTAVTRFSKNANVSSLFGVFYLYFPSVILFAIVMLDLVKEKENLLKNYTNLYGLSNIGYWVSWMIAAAIIAIIISLEIIFLGKYLFGFEFFINSNITIAFTLFFLFGFSMQLFGMCLSTFINTTKSATTVSYSIILIGIVIQSIFTSYGVVFILFAVNINFDFYYVLLKIFSLLMHLYPPFLFSKSFLIMSRINSFHFDGPALQWIPGRYFSFDDLFTKITGKLRIGIEYEVDSLFNTFLWFSFLIILFLIIISFNEMKQNYKFGDKKINNENSYFFFRRYFRFLKKIYSLASVKKLNLIKQNIENSSNKSFDKFLKNEHRLTNLNQDENLSFIMKESHISVINEKKQIAIQNKKRTIPNGLRILSIGKVFENDFEALSDVNLEINKGEVFTILGPNGAGKSTLINILTSQLSSSEGYAKLGPFMIHCDLFIDSIYIKRMIGICSQFDYFWEELTVYETLELYSRLRGIKKEKIECYLDDKLKLVGLLEEKQNLVMNLSGGMKRRLSICISTLGDPFVIFMDEPTSGLDPNNRRRIWKLINTIKKNRVIVLTTHLMDEAEYLSDRLGVVVNGKLRFIGNCTELRKLHLDGIILTISKINFIYFLN